MTKKRVHAFTNDALGEDDAVGLALKVKNKEVSPEELVKASIARAEKVEPHLNAIITKTFDQALLDAKKEPRGFFGGVPMFMKDLTNIEGVKTFYGSEALMNVPPSKKTDPIAKQIFSQGFIHMGQSTLPEFGFTCTTEFTHQKDTRNPWDLDYSTGGSSGGSAALVAAGVLPMAHTADGGGSTRIPAACCGLVGLKASRGRLLASELFQQQIIEVAIDGVTSRSVRDTAHFYAEAEKYYKNPKLKPIGLVDKPLKRKLRIAYSIDSIKNMKTDAPTGEVVKQTVKLLESLGHEVDLVKIPVKDQFVSDFVYLWEMLAYLTKNFGWTMFGKHYDKSKPTNLINGLAKAYPKDIWKTPGFLYRLNKTKHDYTEMFKSLNIDIMLTPTLTHVTPKIGHIAQDLSFETIFDRMIQWASFTPYANASGAPAISLPMGADPASGMPVGMMFWGNHGEESLLLELALQLEEAQPWKKIYE